MNLEHSTISSQNGQLLSDELIIIQRSYYNGKSAQNPEIRNNPESFHPCCCEHVLLRWCSGEVRQVSVVECHEVFWVHVDTYSSELVEVGSQLTQPVRIYHSNIPHKVFGRLNNLIEHNPEML